MSDKNEIRTRAWVGEMKPCGLFKIVLTLVSSSVRKIYICENSTFREHSTQTKHKCDNQNYLKGNILSTSLCNCHNKVPHILPQIAKGFGTSRE